MIRIISVKIYFLYGCLSLMIGLSLSAGAGELPGYRNVALNKPVSASSEQKGFSAAGAVDGDPATMWAAVPGKPEWETLELGIKDPQWIKVDLGAVYEVDKTVLTWNPKAHATAYNVQVSLDGRDWISVYRNFRCSSAVHDVSFPAVPARYVRLYINQRVAGSDCFKLRDWEIFGKPGAANAVLPSPKPYSPPETPSPWPDRLGSVSMHGDARFDSDSIALEETHKPLWHSYPGSDVVANPAGRGEDLPNDLDMRLVVLSRQQGQVIEKNCRVLISFGGGAPSQASSVSSVWYPYQIRYEANYPVAGASLAGYDFSADKHTLLRVLNLTGPDGASLVLKGTAAGQLSGDTDGRTLLVTGDRFKYAMKIMRLKGDELQPVELTEKPAIEGANWSITVPAGEGKVVIGFSYADHSSDVLLARERLLGCLSAPVSKRLAASKAMWDGLLRKVPCPENYEITYTDSKKVTKEMVRRYYYAAWAFLFSNIIDAKDDTSCPYRFVGAGKPSSYGECGPVLYNFSNWESFYASQMLALVDPDLAWQTLKAYADTIREDGSGPYEPLPAQKARSVWLTYKRSGGRIAQSELKAIYQPIKKYLIWNETHLAWRPEGNDEKDISFASQWMTDVDYAIRICKEVGEAADIPMWESKQETMRGNIREWFFAEPNKIYNTWFTKKKTHYHAYRNDDVKNYIAQLLSANIPKDLHQRLVDYYLKTHDPNAPLCGMTGSNAKGKPIAAFSKYGDVIHVVYALFKDGYKKQALELVDSLVRPTVTAGCFHEIQYGNGEGPNGVGPSTFTAMQLIDFTLLKNGVSTYEELPREVPIPVK